MWTLNLCRFFSWTCFILWYIFMRVCFTPSLEEVSERFRVLSDGRWGPPDEQKWGFCMGHHSKTVFSKVLLLWAVLEGLGLVLERSWGGFRRSWGLLKAWWGRLGGRVGRGFDALEPLREPLGSDLGSFTDFYTILCGFLFILGRVLGLEMDNKSSTFLVSFSDHFWMDFEWTFQMKMKTFWKSSCFLLWHMCADSELLKNIWKTTWTSWFWYITYIVFWSFFQ